MRLGLLYDVHGNLPALEAVLDDARGVGVDAWLLGGDYASFGPWPAEVVARLDQLQDATWIRGNWERWQGGDDADAPATLADALRAFRAALGPELVDRLAALPAEHREGDTLFCHGAPGTDMDSFLPEPQPEDDALLGADPPRRLVFGHTHLQFTRVVRGVTLLNPGSVGVPFDGDTRAAWATLDDDGTIDLRRVPYDVEAVIAALRERFGSVPWVESEAVRLREARFPV